MQNHEDFLLVFLHIVELQYLANLFSTITSSPFFKQSDHPNQKIFFNFFLLFFITRLAQITF
jgi:hypothetical protein